MAEAILNRRADAEYDPRMGINHKRFRAFLTDSLLDDEQDAAGHSDSDGNAEALAVDLDGILDLLKEDEEPGDSPLETLNSNFTYPEALFLAELQDYAVAHAVLRRIPSPRARR